MEVKGEHFVLDRFWIIGRHDGMSSHFCHGSHIPHYSSPQKTRHGTFKKHPETKINHPSFSKGENIHSNVVFKKVVQPLGWFCT